MTGLDIFAEHFKEYNQGYLVIGGAACDDHFKEQGLVFRATKDIDLICLKAKAFLDLSKRKADGQRIDSKQIKKHKNDVFRLAATLPGDKQMTLPSSVQKDVSAFIEQMAENPPDMRNLFKEMGIGAIGAEDLIGQLIS